MIKLTVFITACLLLGPDNVHSQAVGDVCGTSCGTALTNAVCNVIAGDLKGTCTCNTGYVDHSGACLAEAVHGAACTQNAQCTGYQQECASSACACVSTHTFTDPVCLTTASSLKAFGATCSANTECQVQTNGGCSTTCGCDAGYFQDTSTGNYQCRNPRYGEACDSSSSVTCDKSILGSANVGGDETAPSCVNSVCTCASTDDHKTFTSTLGVTYNICHTRGSGSRADSATCTNFADCSSNSVCLKCAGCSALQCVALTASSSATQLLGSGMLLLAAFFKYLL